MAERKKVTLVLDDLDAGQIVDGLECRKEAYEKTAAYHRGEEVDVLIEEDCDEHDADQMVDAYQRIIDEIRKQIKEQENAT